MKMELKKKNNAGHWRTLQAICSCSQLDLQLVYMVPRKSTNLLNINTTKFQVDTCEPVYVVAYICIFYDI